MNGWYDAAIISREQAADGMYNIAVDVSGTPLTGLHTRPGQYVHVALGDGREGAFAIASAPQPGNDTFEFLVKGGAKLADALIASPPRTVVRITAPKGAGFPVEQARGHRVLLVATGSGISAIRALIQAIIRDRSAFKDVDLYFGARRPDAFAYEGELPHWQNSGIRVLRTISQAGHPGWEGREGYVQSHISGERLADAVAFVCGQREMISGVKHVLRARGVPEQHIFENI